MRPVAPLFHARAFHSAAPLTHLHRRLSHPPRTADSTLTPDPAIDPSHRPQRPTVLGVVDMYMTKNPEKILGLRRDSFAQLLSYANVQPRERVLVIENCLGVLVGAAAQRLGGEGSVLAAHTHKPTLDGVQWFNPSAKVLATCATPCAPSVHTLSTTYTYKAIYAPLPNTYPPPKLATLPLPFRPPGARDDWQRRSARFAPAEPRGMSTGGGEGGGWEGGGGGGGQSKGGAGGRPGGGGAKQ